MYLPAHFEETRSEVLHRLMRDYPQAVLVTLGSTGLDANHIPFDFDPQPAPFGTLRAHVARSNPVWSDFSREVEALVVFQGAQAYVTPSWYASKAEHGKVVPTYDYMVVHARGPLRVVDDPVWLRGLVERLTNRFESARQAPWQVSDAPADFIEKMLGAIVGFEISVTQLAGKWKASQNRSAADRHGVIAGLREAGDADALAIAEVIEQSL